ncbi:MAG: hypothetical protein ACTS5I_17965, partial [Rhodanobacter sp.]
LRALGMVPWVRRGLPETIAAAVPADGAVDAVDAVDAVACVMVLPSGAGTRELDLLGRALSAAGATLARAARVMVSAGQLAAEVPAAGAYLVFGEAQAHALGRGLPASVMQHAQIVLADELSQVLTQAAAKRRLWLALRTLRRAPASAGG